MKKAVKQGRRGASGVGAAGEVDAAADVATARPVKVGSPGRSIRERRVTHESGPAAAREGSFKSGRREQRAAAIAAAMADAVVAIDGQQQIVFVNPAAGSMFGYSEAELLGKPLAVLIPERYRDAHDAYVRDFARTGASKRGMGGFGTIVGLRADGSEFPVDASIAQIDSAEGRLLGVTLRDIMQRAAAEKALRQNYELLDRIFATTHFCLVYLDRDFNFVRVNKAYADVCGHPPEFFSGKNHFDLYPHEENEAIFRRTVASAQPFTIYAKPFEFPDHPEWGVSYWDWTLHPLKNEQGQVEGLLFALLDVTQRKRAEESLQANETSLRVALKSVDMALFRQDRDLRYTWMYSPQLGYALAEAIGKSDSELLPPEDALQIVELKRAVLETGVGTRAQVRVTKLGREHYFDLVAEPLHDAAGNIVGISGVSLDITEHKRIERELEGKTKLAQMLELLARTANLAATPEDALKACLSQLCGFGDWALARVAITDRLGGTLDFANDSLWQGDDLARHWGFIRASKEVRSPEDGGLLIHVVLREKKPVWLTDIAEAHGFLRRDAALADGLRSAFAFPVLVQGEAIAFLEFYGYTPRPVDSSMVANSEIIAAQIGRLIERRRAERHSAQLATIVETSIDAVLSCGRDGTIRTWNTAAERMFGYAAIEIIGRDVLLLAPAEEQAELLMRFEQMKDGTSLPAYECVRIGKGGRRISVSAAMSPIRDSGGLLTGVSLTFRDIGERKRAEAERARLAAIVESSNDAILIRGLDNAILSWNAAAERLFGWSAQEAIGQTLDLIGLPERTGERRRAAARGESLGPGETMHRRKDGVRIPTQVTFSPVKDQYGKVVAHSYTVRDMTGLKRKEQKLRSLSRRLREVEEAERRAIARELHDRIGQDLSTIALIVAALGAKLSQESLRTVDKQLKDMQQLLKSVTANVRDVMTDLRPPVLDDYGLFAALRQLATEFGGRSSIAVKLSGDDREQRLPSVVETAMYRIVQEALNNTAKHAQAKHVEISLRSARDRSVLEIADDGIGFDEKAISLKKRHWGLATMRERAEAVGIAFDLESAPGAGTRIVLEARRTAR